MSFRQHRAGGGIVRVDGPVVGRRNPLGGIRYSCRRLNLADAVVNADPASVLNGTVTDGGEGVGITVPLLGSKTTADITDDSWFATIPVRDIHNRPVGGEQFLSCSVVVMARATVPVVTDSVRFGVVIHNERDFRSATMDGRGVTASFTSTNPTAGTVSIVNGAPSITNGSSTAGVLGAIASVIRPGLSASNTQQWLGQFCIGLDANFEHVANSEQSRIQSNGTGPGATGFYYATIFACRTNNSDADPFTLKFDAWHTPILSTQRLS